MTEKRFTTNNGVFYKDNETGWEFQSYGEVVDLLNALHEENMELKQQLKTKYILNKQYEELQKVKEENEQLKTQLQNTSDQRDEFHRGARENANRVGRLEKENEQLKTLVDFYKDFQKDARELNKENEELKSELKIYRNIANCGNCHYHNYNWYDDGDEFEVCDKGNDMSDYICEDWGEL